MFGPRSNFQAVQVNTEGISAKQLQILTIKTNKYINYPTSARGFMVDNWDCIFMTMMYRVELELKLTSTWHDTARPFQNKFKNPATARHTFPRVQHPLRYKLKISLSMLNTLRFCLHSLNTAKPVWIDPTTFPPPKKHTS